jgi:hypothetical protein
MIRFRAILWAFVLTTSTAWCAASCKSPPARPRAPVLAPPAPPPPPVVQETVIAHGIAKEDSGDVFVAPDLNSRLIGHIRKGGRFDLVEQRQVEGVLWWRIQQTGWVRDAMVRTRVDGEPTLPFIPFQPRRDNPMPYIMGRVVTDEGVPVYRRPPPRGEEPDQFIDRRLRTGYFFTIDKAINIYDRQLYRGIKYWFIPREGTTPVTPPTFEGIEVTANVHLPFLWTTDPTAKVCPEPLERGASNARCTPLERHHRIPVSGEQRVQGGLWYQTEGGFVGAPQVARIDRLATLPAGLHAGERWIHVDLRNQFAALYEGTDIKFVTLISSGDDQHATPPGTYRVQSKHVSATMDDEDNMSSAFFIQDVPWVMYFQGGYALHAAFWHDRFGLRTSHGCVNLSPRDARRFFEFADSPTMVPGLHSMVTPPDRPGTLVHVTR